MVSVNRTNIEYSLKYSRRKTIGIYVSAEKGVEVRVPYFVSREEALTFVSSKQEWIEKQLQTISARPARIEPDYRWGGKVYFLGEAQTIHCDQSSGADLVFAGALHEEPDKIERRVSRWFRSEALLLFQERHLYWCEQMASMQIPESTLQTRMMKRRWGTCRQNGNIIINTQLAKYPLECVDVVIVHELCHLFEFNHGKRFYQLMSAILPDWKQRDAMLNDLSLKY